MIVLPHRFVHMGHLKVGDECMVEGDTKQIWTVTRILPCSVNLHQKGKPAYMEFNFPAGYKRAKIL